MKERLEIQRNETDMTANDSGDDNTSPPLMTISQNEERLVSQNAN